MNILVTAGPTREALDPVRFLSNRSTGRMGYAVAAAAVEQGHAVRLISGPVELAASAGVEVVQVESAEEMLEAVAGAFVWCDALVMSAAVADWRPRVRASEKLKKADMSGTLELERTPDVLKAVALLKREQVVIGFAAETENMLREARRKLAEKHLDMVVANDVSRPDSGFGVDTNAVTFVTPEADKELPLLSKLEVGRHIIEWISGYRHHH